MLSPWRLGKVKTVLRLLDENYVEALTLAADINAGPPHAKKYC
jgi:hypothetical protein